MRRRSGGRSAGLRKLLDRLRLTLHAPSPHANTVRCRAARIIASVRTLGLYVMLIPAPDEVGAGYSQFARAVDRSRYHLRGGEFSPAPHTTWHSSRPSLEDLRSFQTPVLANHRTSPGLRPPYSHPPLVLERRSTPYLTQVWMRRTGLPPSRWRW